MVFKIIIELQLRRLGNVQAPLFCIFNDLVPCVYLVRIPVVAVKFHNEHLHREAVINIVVTMKDDGEGKDQERVLGEEKL